MEERTAHSLIEDKELLPLVEKPDNFTFVFAVNLRNNKQIFIDRERTGLVYGFQSDSNVWKVVYNTVEGFKSRVIKLSETFFVGDVNGTVS